MKRTCPSCNHEIEISQAMAAATPTCPKCGAEAPPVEGEVELDEEDAEALMIEEYRQRVSSPEYQAKNKKDLAKYAVLIVICLVALFFLSKYERASEENDMRDAIMEKTWTTYREPAGTFTLDFPETPKDDSDGEEHSLHCPLGDNGDFSALVMTTSLAKEKILDLCRKMAVDDSQEGGYTILEQTEKSASTAGHPGLEIKLKVEGVYEVVTTENGEEVGTDGTESYLYIRVVAIDKKKFFYLEFNTLGDFPEIAQKYFDSLKFLK